MKEPRERGRESGASPDGRESDEAERDEVLGEAAGGVAGTLTGAALGSAAGPLGTIVGGIAGAVGGWWAGEKIAHAAEDMTLHEEYYREHYRANPRPDLDYDTARVGYGLGHIAGHHPGYRGRSFSEIEDELRKYWEHEERDYSSMRPYIRHAYERSGGSRQDT